MNRTAAILVALSLVTIALAAPAVAGSPESGIQERPTRTIESCTVLDEPGTYELSADVRSETDGVCLYVRASDVVLDGNGHAVVGSGIEESVGIQVSGYEGQTVDNVTVRNVHVRGWKTGIRPSSFGDPGLGVEVRLANVSTTNNTGRGVFLGFADDSELENVTADGNGLNGIEAREVRNTTFERITVADNGEHGLYLRDNVDDSTFRNVTATGNADFGVVSDIETERNAFSRVYAANNSEGGVLLDTGSREITDSVVVDNGEVGISVQAGKTTLDNVTVRGHDAWEVRSGSDYVTLNASDLRVGSARVRFEDEPVSLDYVPVDSLPSLPENATHVGAGVTVTNVEAGVTVSVPLDSAAVDGDSDDRASVGLWRYDGAEWTSVADDLDDGDAERIEATVTRDGLYAPVVVGAADSGSEPERGNGPDSNPGRGNGPDSNPGRGNASDGGQSAG